MRGAPAHRRAGAARHVSREETRAALIRADPGHRRSCVAGRGPDRAPRIGPGIGGATPRTAARDAFLWDDATRLAPYFARSVPGRTATCSAAYQNASCERPESPRSSKLVKTAGQRAYQNTNYERIVHNSQFRTRESFTAGISVRSERRRLQQRADIPTYLIPKRAPTQTTGVDKP